MKKKLSVLLACLLVFTLALAGCQNAATDEGTNNEGTTNEGTNNEGTNNESNTNNESTPSTDNSGDETTAVSGTVNTDGSTSMADVMAALTEAFKEVQPDVTINYTGSGSGAGIEGAMSGTCDIGLSSRELSEEETGAGAVANVIAKDGVAVVVNPENGVSDLTVEQIASIFKGEITNWSELGGSDAPIAVFGREAGSGTRSAFEEIVGVEDACVYTNEYSSTGDIIGNVASNPNAIGYASLSAVDDTVKAVMVNGVECNEDTVRDGSYEIQRPFVMVTVEGTELSDAAQAFLDYAMSPDAADVIASAGVVAAN